jgi:hypothetical protein
VLESEMLNIFVKGVIYWGIRSKFNKPGKASSACRSAETSTFWCVDENFMNTVSAVAIALSEKNHKKRTQSI